MTKNLMFHISIYHDFRIVFNLIFNYYCLKNCILKHESLGLEFYNLKYSRFFLDFNSSHPIEK